MERAGLHFPPARLARLKGARQVAVAGPYAFFSGQTALREDGSVVGIDDVAAQVEQVYANLEQATNAIGRGLGDIVKTTTFLTDASQHLPVQQFQQKLFGDAGPTNSTVIVTGLARPELLIEIEAIVFMDTQPPDAPRT